MSVNENEHLEEVTTKQRINLVKNDNVRKYGQIIIAFILIGGMVAYLGWYTLTQASDIFKEDMANEMKVLLIMGVGASLAIFGLGRTVGRKS